MDVSFEWSTASIESAQLIAAGDLGITDIAEKVGVTRQTLWNWRRNPVFAAQVNEHQEEIRQEIRRRGIAVLERRVAALDDRWRRLEKIMHERAADMKGVPGGESGLLVRRKKMLGYGENAEMVEEYAVDTGLLAELRDHEKQAAQELGQWTEKKSVDQVVKSYAVGNSPDDL